MTGKRNDTSTSRSDIATAALEAELAYHEDAARNLELSGNTDTYHHQRAAQLRVELNIVEDKNGKLD